MAIAALLITSLESGPNNTQTNIFPVFLNDNAKVVTSGGISNNHFAG